MDRLQQLGARVDERYVPNRAHNWVAWKIQMRAALPMLLSSVGVA
ncbi:hypothetical protein [Nocardia abscessus]|nr:hypothetical protein [Nocardia abscessus]